MKENKLFDKQAGFSGIIAMVVQNILRSCDIEKCFQHLDAAPIPSHDAVASILHKTKCILFPGYFIQSVLTPSNLESPN